MSARSHLVLLVLVNLIVVRTQLVEPPPAPDTELRFVQVVFRHGDRAPLLKQVPNDPFRDEKKFWPYGLTQLTKTGRVRMYRMGQWLRERYGDYLGNAFSPREVFARSSASDRCLATMQLVLAGCYPPNSTTWQWDIQNYPLPLAHLWQAVPFSSFVPMDEDTLLRMKKYCPAVDREKDRLYNSPQILKMIEDKKPLLDQLSQLAGKKMSTLEVIDEFWENLNIEHLNGYYWFAVNGSQWLPEFEQRVYEELKPFTQERWNRELQSEFVQRIRTGELINTIAHNFQTAKAISGDLGWQELKIHFYSTHDTKLSAILHGLKVWEKNGLIPFGAALLFELHRNVSKPMDYFVRILYMNKTMSLLDDDWQSVQPHVLCLPDCDYLEYCPLERYDLMVADRLKPGDWNTECGIVTPIFGIGPELNLLLLVGNSFLMFILCLSFMYVWSKKKCPRDGYEKLK